VVSLSVAAILGKDVKCRPVNPNASSNLKDALITGSASYDVFSAMTIYYGSARNQITTNSKVIPAVLAVVNPLLGQLNAEYTANFLASHAKNAMAVQTALQCKRCLSSPFAAKQVDLRPFDVATATGSTMVGLIFVSCTETAWPLPRDPKYG
jgi:Protein of unknown function (DUF3533)